MMSIMMDTSNKKELPSLKVLKLILTFKVQHDTCTTVTNTNQ